jgi:nucleoid-associated protein YgaU
VPASTQGEQPTEPAPQAPGFGERGRMRRRARFLRRARELAYRDLGGLVFDLHRFGQRNDQVVLAKLATLGHIDAELRSLEVALREIRPVTVLREAGIAACPRCAAIHGSDDRFCPGCGLAFDMSADRPLSTAPVTAPAQATAAPAPTSVAAAPAATSATPPDLSIGRPATPVEPAPPVKPTAAPVAARPTPTAPSPSPSTDNGEHKREPEDEPTQILRPPARGA